MDAVTTGGQWNITASPYGDLLYDDTDNCSSANVELAYVTNRVVVQTTRPADVATLIDQWRAATSAGEVVAPFRRIAQRPATLRGSLALVDDAQTRPVDHIAFDRFEHPGDRIDPVWVFELPGRRGHDIVGLARFLAKDHGLSASPDYVTRLSGPRHFFEPDGLPLETTEDPAHRDPFNTGGPELGSGVGIMVFDSGLVPSPDLSANVGVLRPIDEEQADRDGDLRADTGWVGHGLAISSETSGLAPGATVTNVRVTRAGISTEFTAAKAIVETLEHVPASSWPAVLVASFGTMACDMDPANPLPGDELNPVALRLAAELVDRLSERADVDMIIVAAAGNHGTERRAYPAAFDSVLAVGAIDATLDADGSPLTTPSRTGPVAEFSARAGWVDVYAPGVHIVTVHVDGLTFGRGTDKVTLEGRALVQGTSFAAPYAGTQISELMATHGISTRQAVDLLVLRGEPVQEPCDGSARGADIGGPAVALFDLDQPSDVRSATPATEVC